MSYLPPARRFRDRSHWFSRVPLQRPASGEVPIILVFTALEPSALWRRRVSPARFIPWHRRVSTTLGFTRLSKNGSWHVLASRRRVLPREAAPRIPQLPRSRSTAWTWPSFFPVPSLDLVIHRRGAVCNANFLAYWFNIDDTFLWTRKSSTKSAIGFKKHHFQGSKATRCERCRSDLRSFVPA